MALIGIEYNDHFADVRASGAVTGAEDLSSPYYIANWFGAALADAGHDIAFLRSNHATNERHMRDTAAFQGDDAQNADSVDLFMINTHGDYADHECLVLYDTKIDSWIGHSQKWRFGDGCNLEWLMLVGCFSVDLNNILDHHPVFLGLHLMCGVWLHV